MSTNKLNLDTIAGGAASDQFARALSQVLENIQDLNTDADKKRKIIIELTFTPNETRKVADISVTSKTQLAPSSQALTTIVMEKNSSTGVVTSKELRIEQPEMEFIDAEIKNERFR